MSNIGFKENLVNEFKSDRTCLPDSDIIDAVVAFANTDGGDLYLGVENDGQITGLHNRHKDITQLAAFIANRTVPPVSVRSEILEFDLPVLRISVPKRPSVVLPLMVRFNAAGLSRTANPKMYPCIRTK